MNAATKSLILDRAQLKKALTAPRCFTSLVEFFRKVAKLHAERVQVTSISGRTAS
ncbi:MAG TPA: hypothetical protein VFH75_06040 [Actinomycetota bacterium]|nr:hypothetical protein [Actinomycetota bacterium]